MSKKNTVPILYHAGSYGVYLDWCLTTLTTNQEIESPLNANGNSHNFKNGHWIRNIEEWRHYISSTNEWNFARLHPKKHRSDDLHQILNEISNQVNFFIYIYPSDNTLLLTLNNQFTKVWEDWWKDCSQSEELIDKIYANWPIDQTTTIDQIPNWIKRELLSYYLLPMYFDQLAWSQPNHYNQNNCIVIFVDDLLYDFKNTIFRIVNQAKLTLIKPIDLLVPHHTQMLNLQKNINQDRLCKEILDSIVTQKMFDWKNQSLTLASESYLQWQLRNLGYELQCHGLDMFPTNSVQLKELLYTV